MGFRVLLSGIVISIVLAACGVQDAPGEQSLAQTAAPDDPYPIATQPVASPTLEQTSEPTFLPKPTEHAVVATAPAPTIVVRQTGHYTMTTATMPSQLVAWSPDGKFLLTTNVNQPPWLGNLALGRAFLLDLQTGTGSVLTDPIIVGYNFSSYVFAYQEPEWLASGIRLSRPNKDGSPELVELNPYTSEHAEHVLAELGTGTFHSHANGEVLALTDTTLHQPNRAAQTVSLPTDPQVAWMTHFSDDLLVYVPNTTTIKLRTLATGEEQTWTLDQLPDVAELCCIEVKNGPTASKAVPLLPEEVADAHVANLALSADSRYLALAVAHKHTALDLWMLDTSTQDLTFIERVPYMPSTYFEWSPDSDLLAYIGHDDRSLSKAPIWKLYSATNQQIVYSSNEYVMSFIWDSTSTRIAVLTTGQEYIDTYEVIR